MQAQVLTAKVDRSLVTAASEVAKTSGVSRSELVRSGLAAELARRIRGEK